MRHAFSTSLQAKLPICIGGSGRRRTLPLAARFADHWNYGGTDPTDREAFQAVGADLAIVALPKTAPPSIVDQLADVLTSI